MPAKALSPEEKLRVLDKMKLLGRIWSGFFADPKYPTAIEATFSGSSYRAVFINLLRAELEGTEVDEEQLLTWLPDKDRRTKEKRRDELVEAALLIESGKKADGEKRLSYRLGDDLRNHLEAYADYFADIVDLSDPRIQRVLAA